MKKAMNRFFALLLGLMMALDLTPFAALATTSTEYDPLLDLPVAASLNAFQITQKAIDDNAGMGVPFVFARAEASPQTAIPTGQLYKYEVNYTFNPAPSYVLTSNEDVVPAYSKYENVQFVFTAPTNVELYDDKGEVKYGSSYTFTLGDVGTSTSASFKIGARMTNNGQAPSGTAYDKLGVTLSADVSVTDQNQPLSQNNPQTLHFTADKVPVNTDSTAVANYADSAWTVLKENASISPVGETDTTVTFNWLVKVGKATASSGALTSDPNDYDKVGILNVEAFTLTDTLPTFIGVNGSEVKPISSTLTPLDKSGNDVAASAVVGGQDQLTLACEYLNSYTLTDKAQSTGDTQFYTEYRVSAVYPRAELILPYGDARKNDGSTFTLTNQADISYRMVGMTDPRTADDDAAALYQENTAPGQINVLEKLLLAVGDEPEVDYNLFYSRIFSGPAVFSVYAKAEYDAAADISALTPVATLSITDTRDETQTKTGDLAPGEYVVVQTTRPTGSEEAVPSVQTVAVPSGEVAEVTFKNPIIGKGLLRFKKTDANGAPLSGATFRLYKSGSEYTATTAIDGTAYILADIGDYKLEETTPPAGYVLDETQRDITIEAGKTNLVYYDAPIVNTANLAELNIRKFIVGYERANRDYPEADKKKLNEVTGASASDFVFKLERSITADFSTSELVGEYTVDQATSMHTVTGLARTDANNAYYYYRLSENDVNAAAGKYFTKDSYVYTWQFNAAATQTCEFYNLLKSELSFIKVQYDFLFTNRDIHSVLGSPEGKEFKLYKQTASGFEQVGDVLTSDANGLVTSASLPICDENGSKISYYIQEVVAQGSYTPNPIVEAFLINGGQDYRVVNPNTSNTVTYPTQGPTINGADSWGPITLDWAKTKSLSTAGNASTLITNRLNLGQIKVAKYGVKIGNGGALPGAKFNIYYYPNNDTAQDRIYLQDADGQPMLFVTRSPNGFFVVQGVEIGLTYYLEEIEPPAGYELGTNTTHSGMITEALGEVYFKVTNVPMPKFKLTKKVLNPCTNSFTTISNVTFTFDILKEETDAAGQRLLTNVTTVKATMTSGTATFPDVSLDPGTYYIKEKELVGFRFIDFAKHPELISKFNITGEVIDGEFYYGPFTLRSNVTTRATVVNVMNYGAIYIYKRDQKTNELLTGAKYHIAGTVKNTDVIAKVYWSQTGIAKDTSGSGSMTFYTDPDVITRASAGKIYAWQVMLPIYDGEGNAIPYTVVESEAPAGYLPPEDNAPKIIYLDDYKDNNYIAELTYVNAKSANLTVRKYLNHRWEIASGHVIDYAQAGAVFGAYLLQNDGTLAFTGMTAVSDANGLAKFTGLNAVKSYVIVELSAPLGTEPENGRLPVDENEPNGMQSADVLSTFNARLIDLNVSLTGTASEYVQSKADAFINLDGYIQFQLIKRDEDNPNKLLKYAKYHLYSCMMEDLNDYLSVGSHTDIFAAMKNDGKLQLSNYTYETGTALGIEGAFQTESQTAGLVYWFEEYQTPFGYVYGSNGGIVGPLVPVAVNGVPAEYVYTINTLHTVDDYNKLTSGGGSGGSVIYFQVKLDKALYSSTGSYIGKLSNVRFELWLADAGFTPQVKLTHFTTGLDAQGNALTDPGRGISESFEFGNLYEQHPGLITRDPQQNGAAYYNYTANFVLKEVAYPADSTPVQTEYPLTISTNITSGGFHEILDTTYTGANAIRNIQAKLVPIRIRKMGYSVANGVPTSEAGTTPLEGVQIGLYTNANCTALYAAALTNAQGYAIFQVNPNTTYWYKEIATIPGYELNPTIGSLISQDYGQPQSESYVLYDPAYRSLTLRKLDANGNPLAGVALRIVKENGSPITDANGAPIANNTLITDANGFTPAISLPNGSYRVEEISLNGVAYSAVDQSYFKLVNSARLPITFAATEAAKTVELVNPGKGSLELTKIADAGYSVPGVSFNVEFKPFTSRDEFQVNVIGTTYSGFNSLGIWMTDEFGKIAKSNLTPGWYRLFEIIPSGYSMPESNLTLLKVQAKHMVIMPNGSEGEPTPATVTVVNTRMGCLTIKKVFAASDFYTIPSTLTFSLYKDAECRTPAVPATITLNIDSNTGEGTETVVMDPGDYYIKESTHPSWIGSYTVTVDGLVTASGWANDAAGASAVMPVPVVAGSKDATATLLTVNNTPVQASVKLLKTDDGTPAVSIQGVTFAIGYEGANREIIYYQNNNTWTADTTNRKLWTTSAEGLAEIIVTLPLARVQAGQNGYIIEEISAPQQYVMTQPIDVTLNVGDKLDLTGTPIVNATGMYIRLQKFGRARAHATVGDVLAGAEFTLYLVKNGRGTVVAKGVTANDGTLEFTNLTKLSGNDTYAIAETLTPATHVAGLLEVYDENDAPIQQIDIGGKLKAYPVTSNANVTLKAYNTPKGGIAVLKYNYLDPTTVANVPKFATFDVYAREGTKDTLLQSIAVGEVLTDDPQTLDGGSVVKGAPYYVGQSGVYKDYLFTDYVLMNLAPGTYYIEETGTPEGFYYTPDSVPGDPWYTRKEVVVDDDGGVTCCYFANVPNPKVPDNGITKEVIAVNGQSASLKLDSLQGDAWQTITYSISDFASSASKLIQLKLDWLELQDLQMDFYDRLDGVTTAEHYVNSVTVGKAYYQPTMLTPVPATTPIYATVYGWINGTATKLSTVDVTSGSKLVRFNGDYTGFSIDYGTDVNGTRTGLNAGFTTEPVIAEMRLRQADDAAIRPATRIVNTAKVRMSYAIGTTGSVATSWVADDANAISTPQIDMPKASVDKTALKLDDSGNVLTGDAAHGSSLEPGKKVRYVITMTNKGQNAGEDIIDPVLLDELPDLLEIDITTVRVTAPATLTYTAPSLNGNYVYTRFTGRLEPNASISLTFDCTVKSAAISVPNTSIINKAYAFSTYKLAKNVDNPTGTPFLDLGGNLPSHLVDGTLIGQADSYMALMDETTHQLTQSLQMSLMKLVTTDLTQPRQYYGTERFVLVGAEGAIDYQVVLTNGGESSFGAIRFVDKLPTLNDQTIGLKTERYSKWPPTLVNVTNVTLNGAPVQYTLYTTATPDDGNSYNNSVVGGASAAGIWNTGVTQGAVALMLEVDPSVTMQPGDQLVAIFSCKAPGAATAISSNAYFRMAVNNVTCAVTGLNATVPNVITSNIVKVALMPTTVSLGNRIWIDKNGDGLQNIASGEDYDAETGTFTLEPSLTGVASPNITLRTFENSDTSSTEKSKTLDANGFYRFENLMPATLNAAEINSAYDANGDIINSKLLGNVRTSYQLVITNLPTGYLPTKVYSANGGNVPKAGSGMERRTDSNFRYRDGVLASEKFYLESATSYDTTFDLGLVRYRNLNIKKTGTDSRLISGAQFKIYGPYDNREINSALTLTDAKLVDTITTNGSGIASFTSTSASHFLNYYRYYVVVESDSSAPYYLSSNLIATGSGIAAASAYPGITGGGVGNANYFVLLPRDENDGTLTENVDAKNTYTATGWMLLNGVKTLEGETLAADQFEFVLTSTGKNADPDFAAAYPTGAAVRNGQNGNFVFPRIDYDYADVGKTYVYTVKETNDGVIGYKYDGSVFTVSAAITDNGDGTLNVDKTYTSGNQPVSGLAFNNVSQGLLIITKTVAGNAGDTNKDFAFTVKLTKQNRPVVGTFNCSGNGALPGGTITFDADGIAAFTLKHGQRIEISGIETGVRYTVTESDYTGEGYVTTPSGGVVTAAILKPTNGNATPNKADYINERNVGSLEVSKMTDGNGASQTKNFLFTLTLTNANGINVANMAYACEGAYTSLSTDANGVATFELAHNQKVLIKGIPVGTAYKVVETNYTAEGYVTTYSGDNGLILASQPNGQPTTVSAAFTNKREVGGLTVRKALSGNATDPNKAFDMTIRLSNATVNVDGEYDYVAGGGYQPATGKISFVSGAASVSLRGNESLTVVGIPVNTAYSVTEASYTADGYITAYTYSDTASTPVMTTNGASVTVTNTRNTYGTLEIKKVVSGNAGDPDKAFSFTLTLTPQSGYDVNGKYKVRRTTTGNNVGVEEELTVAGNSATFTLKHDECLTIPGILTGTAYSVVEDSYIQDGYQTTQSGYQGTISADRATYTVTYTNTRNVGAIAISKAVGGNAASTTKQFNFTLTLSRNDAASVNKEYDAVLTTNGVSQNTKVRVSNGMYRFTLTDKQTLTIKNIQTDTAYTVTEDDYTADGYTTANPVRSGTVGSTNTPTTLSYLNTRNAGVLKLTKILQGNGTSTTDTFDFHIVLSRTDGMNLIGSYTYTLNGNPASAPLSFTATQTAGEAEADITLHGGDTVEIADILAGTSYTVTEADYGTLAYGTASIGDSGTVTVSGANATFTNERNVGELTVTKTLSGNATDQTKAFDITIMLSRQDNVVLDGDYAFTSTGATPSGTATVTNGVVSFSLRGGESYTLKGIPVGTAYTVAEADYSAEGYITDITYGDPARVLTITGASVTVNNANNTYGTLIIGKTVDGNNGEAERAFAFTLNLSRTDALAVDGIYNAMLVDNDTTPATQTAYSLNVQGGNASFTLTHNQSLSIPGILTGTEYNVTEDDYSGDGYHTAPQNREHTGVIQDSQQVYTANYTNTRSVGALAVSKTVSGNAGDSLKAFSFTLNLSRTDNRPYNGTYTAQRTNLSGTSYAPETVIVANGTASFQLVDGETLTIAGIPTGTDYTVTEADYTLDGYQTIPATRTYTGQVGTESAPAALGYTNTRDTGSLSLIKTFSGNGGRATDTFDFHIVLSRTDGYDLAGSYEYTRNGVLEGQITFDAQGEGNVTLSGGDTVVILGILADTDYAVSESDYSTLAYGTTSSDETGVISAAGSSTTFTNERNVGDLTVLKALAGNAASATRAFSITIELTRTDNVTIDGSYAYTATGGYAPETGSITFVGGRATVNLLGNQSLTVLGIPVGTAYTVTEADYSGEGYITDVAYSDPNRTLATEGATVTVTNTNNAYGSLVIGKTVDGNDGETDRDFAFTLNLSRSDSLAVDGAYRATLTDNDTNPATLTTVPLDIVNGTVSFTLTHNQSLSIPGILTGTEYTVTEDDYSGDGYQTLPANRVQTGVIINSQQAYSVAFINRRNVGSLTIQKTVGGNAGDTQKAFDFQLTLSRNDGFDIDGVYQAVLSDDGAADARTITVSGGEASFTLTDGQSLTIDGILTGTAYTVTEEDYTLDGYTTTPSNRVYSGTVGDGSVPTLLDYTNLRYTGALILQKTLVGDATDATDTFTFHIALSRTDGITLAGDYETEMNGVAADPITFDAQGRADVTLMGGQTLAILGIPSGTAYTVTEDDYTAIGYTTTSTGDSGMVTDVGATAVFTNARYTGSLTLRKVLTGNAVEPEREFSFTIAALNADGTPLIGEFTLSGDRTGTILFTAGLATTTLRGGESITIGGLPIGVFYAVSEAEANTEMYVTTWTGETGSIAAGTEAIVECTNARDIAQQYRELAVTKIWNDQANADNLRPGTIVVYLYADGVAINRAELNAANGWGATFTNLPTLNIDGTTINYTVVEVATAGYFTNYGYTAAGVNITNTHTPDAFAVLTTIEDGMVPLGGNINMNEGDCFN